MWIISYLIIVYVYIFIYNSETFIILLGNNCQYTYNSVRPWYPLRFGIDLYTSNVLRACKTGSIHNAIYKTPHGWNARFLGQTRRRECPFLRASKGFWTIGGKYLKLLPPPPELFSAALSSALHRPGGACSRHQPPVRQPWTTQVHGEGIPANTAVNTGSLRTSVRKAVALARVLIDEIFETWFTNVRS